MKIMLQILLAIGLSIVVIVISLWVIDATDSDKNGEDEP